MKTIAALVLSLAATSAFAGNNLMLCESNGGARATCSPTLNNGTGPTVTDVEKIKFSRQVSRTPCIEGITYRLSSNSVTVDRGCRAEFKVLRRSQSRNFRCESTGFEYVSCPAKDQLGNPAELVRIFSVTQISRTACRFATDGTTATGNYGYLPNAEGVWANGGCRVQGGLEVRPYLNR